MADLLAPDGRANERDLPARVARRQPAVDPPRRVVDAGYYDNYGVDLATSWIYVHQKWICENTSGVALIQIRAYPSEQAVLSYFGAASVAHPDLIARLKKRVVCGFQGLTSPLAGGLRRGSGACVSGTRPRSVSWTTS